MELKHTVIRLQGGLGNQMFQYAFGRALSLRNGSKLFLDLSTLNPKKNRGYALDNFLLTPNFATSDILKGLITPHFAFRKKLWKALKVPFKYAPTHILEKTFAYTPSIANNKTSAYYDGYWQSEKYFADFAGAVKADFAFRNEQLLQKCPQFDEICNTNSVAIHIRRGDYIKNPKYKKRLYVCTLPYYLRAIAYLRERHSNLNFFIASDDPKWVAENFELSNQTKLIKSNSAIEDFFLMANCKHQIISNSSFSWWCAWLNRNPNKTVIAPNQWFTKFANIDYGDIVPASWVKLPINTNETL